MKGQYDNKLMSSFMLWFDHTLTKKGEAFTNTNSLFYSVDNLYQGYNTYGTPFRQFVADSSIPDATIISGVHVDGVFKERTESNFTAINYGMAQSYFDADQGAKKISGDYAVKDFNIFLTNKTEEKLLFETQFQLNNKVSTDPTGLPPESMTYPAVFLKNMGGRNEGFAFGGTQKSEFNVRAIVMSDSQFTLDATASIFRDENHNYVGVLEENEMPFNHLGDFSNGTDYNYTGITANKGGDVYIKNVYISKIGGVSYAGIDNLNPNAYTALIDFELEKIRDI
tara:strand:- start:2431 stop:3276 length:846 start_codon:yes stop_codon:yes gene_type:complete